MDVVLIMTGFSFCTFRLPPLTYKLAFGSDYYSFGCNQPIIFFFHTKSAPTSASQYFSFITNQYQPQPNQSTTNRSVSVIMVATL